MSRVVMIQGDALEFLGQAAGKAAYDRTVAMIAIMTNDRPRRERIQRRRAAIARVPGDPVS